MNADHLAQFYETAGYTVVRSPSSYWYNASDQLYQSIPPGVPIDPSHDELNALFHGRCLAGVQFPTTRKRGVESALFVVKDKRYGFDSLQRQFRQHVRKGLTACLAQEIDFDYLYRHGPSINQEALARRRQWMPQFLDDRHWLRYCDAGKRTSGAGVIGSFVKGQLVSYLVYFVADRICHGLHMMSKTNDRVFRPNHLLYFVFTQSMILRPEIAAVSTGLRSFPKAGDIDEFKRHAGYETEICYLSVELRRPAKLLLLSRPLQSILKLAEAFSKSNPRLRRVRAVLEAAKATEMAGELQ